MKYVYKYVIGHNLGRNVWEAKEFETQKALFRYLVTEKDLVIEQRKSIEVKFCEGSISMLTQQEVSVTKAAVYENDKEAGILKRTILANTYWWMDAMSDVHIGRGDGEKAVFTETIKNRTSKIPPIDEHNYGLNGRMGRTLDIYEAPISWRALGVGRTGMTEGLFAVAQIEKAKNENRYNDYLNNEIDQHSVGMIYVDIELAVNDAEEFPREHAVWQKYIGKIGNRTEVESQGFFFAVAEAKLREYSAVIAGANPLTPVIGGPSGDSHKADPSGDSQHKQEAFRLAVLKISSKLLN